MEVQRFPRPFVESPCDPVEVSLRVRRQIGLPREILAQQPIAVQVANRHTGQGAAGRMVGAETRTFAFDEMRRLIERNPEFEKLFVARGLRHPQPEVRWRKKK